MSIIALVISIVDSEHPRHLNALRQLHALNIEGEFVSGIKKGHSTARDLYSPAANLIFAKRSLTPEEMACYASHRKAWQVFLDSGAANALVLEDDFYVPDPARLRQAIADCMTSATRWDIVKFFEFSRKRVWRRAFFGSTALVAYKYQSAGAVAYLINRKAAQNLLSRKRIFRPVDEDLSWNWEFGLRLWTTESNLVEDISTELGGSHIEDGRKSSKRERNTGRIIWANVIQGWKFSRSVLHHGRCLLERR